MQVDHVANHAHSEALISLQSWGDPQGASSRDLPWPDRVQNTPVALAVSFKESSLSRKIKSTRALSVISNIEQMPNRNQRFMAMGAAVTAVVNLSERKNIGMLYPWIPLAASKMESICTKYPFEGDRSRGYIKRGADYVEGLTDANKEVDAELYSTGLGMGFGMLQDDLDINKISYFSQLSVIRQQAKPLEGKD